MKQVFLIGGARDGELIILPDNTKELKVPSVSHIYPMYIESSDDILDMLTYSVITYAPQTEADYYLNRWTPIDTTPRKR